MKVSTREKTFVAAILLAGGSSLFDVSAFTPRPTKPLRVSSLLRVALDPTTNLDTDIIQVAKETLVKSLQQGEEENSDTLKPFVETLRQAYKGSGIDARTSNDPAYNGDWTNINTPAFMGRLGFDQKTGLPLYKVKSLTFGLLETGTDLECVVERMIQHVHFAEELPDRSVVPSRVQEAFDANPLSLRHNHIDTEFFLAADPQVRGVFRMEGYTIPHIKDPNKYETWFVQGRCLPDPAVDPKAFASRFGTTLDDDDDDESKLSYSLPNAMLAYQTVVYLDNDLRITVGNRGSVMINGRENVYA